MKSFSTHNTKETIGDLLKDTTGSLKWKLQPLKNPNYDNIYLLKESRKFFKAPCYNLATDELPESYKGGHYQARNDLQQTESRLKYANEMSNKKREDLASQWKELEAKEEKLKSSFIEFNTFLISNAHKRRRAEQKYKDKNTQKKEKIEAIEAMSTNIALMKATAEKMQINTAKFDMYEKFLRLVVNQSSFRDIISVIRRFLLLQETKIQDIEKMQDICGVFDAKQVSYAAKVHDFQVCYLQFSTELSELRNRYDVAKKKTNAWEMVMENICNKYTKIAQDMSWVGMAIRHLFEVAHYHLKEEHKKKVSMDKLAHINASLKALEIIKEKLSKLHEKKYPVTSMEGGLSYDKLMHRKSRVQEFDEKEPSSVSGVPTSIAESNKDHKRRFWSKKLLKRVQPMKLTNCSFSGISVPSEKGVVLLTEWKRIEKQKEYQKGETSEPEQNFPIKLSKSNYAKVKVPNFVELYKRALIGIQNQKMAKKIPKLSATSKDWSGPSEVGSRNGEQRFKWAIPSSSQLAEGDTTTISETNPVQVGIHSGNVLTLIEDVADEDDRKGKTWLQRKSITTKEIERKFEKLSVLLNKELVDRERAQTLPPIYQAKAQNSTELFMQKKEAYFRIHKEASLKKSLGIIGAKRARRLSQISRELPCTYDLSGRNNSLDSI